MSAAIPPARDAPNGSLRYGASLRCPPRVLATSGRRRRQHRTGNVLTRRLVPRAEDLDLHHRRSATGGTGATVSGMFEPQPRRVHRRRRHGVLVGGRLVDRVPAPSGRAHGRVRRRRRRRQRRALPACRRTAGTPCAACTCTPRGCAASSSRPTRRPPAWLLDHPRVTIVRSEEFFADPSVLPTHNSHAVEAQLHRIDGPGRALPLLQRRHVLRAPRSSPSCSSPRAGCRQFVECEVRIGAGRACAAPQRARQRSAGQPCAAARALRTHHRARPRALRGAAAARA